MSDRQYKDVSGNPCKLLWLVKNEPEWAESQIRHRDKLERALAAAKERIARLEEAGDAMLNAWLMPEDSMEYSDWVALSADAKAKWYTATEVQP